jgi:hypothetical protein
VLSLFVLFKFLFFNMSIGQKLYNSISPPAFKLLPKEQRLMQQMYPQIDWKKVEFHTRMPWFMQYTFAIGVALPSAYNREKVHIYLREKDQKSLNERLAIMVHEAFHAQQYHDLASMNKGSWGWGYNRRFMRYYLGWYFQMLYEGFFKNKLTWKDTKQQAYRQHPMELTAYRQEGIFRNHINAYRGHSVIGFFKQVPQLICTNSHVPPAPAFVFHITATLLCVLIALSKPLLDAILLPLALLLGGRSETPAPQES